MAPKVIFCIILRVNHQENALLSSFLHFIVLKKRYFQTITLIFADNTYLLSTENEFHAFPARNLKIVLLYNSIVRSFVHLDVAVLELYQVLNRTSNKL